MSKASFRRSRRAFWGVIAALAVQSALHAHAACVLQRIAELPATMRSGRALVSIKLNGQDNLMAVDSGAFFSTLDVSKAKELRLREISVPSGAYLIGAAGAARMGVVRADQFDLAGIPLKNVDFVTTDVSDDIGAGLLGQNILGFADVEYDLPHGIVRLFKPKDCGSANLAYWAKDTPYSVIPRIAHAPPDDKRTFARLTVNGTKMEALLDTGATTIIKRSSAARAGVHPEDAGVSPGERSGGIGEHVIMTWVAPFKSIMIGDEEVRNTHLTMSDLKIDEDALLGIDFFISHRVYVSNSQNKIYFTYEGGPVFGAAAEARERDEAGPGEHSVDRRVSEEAEPTDAMGFLRRGTARLSRNDLDGARSDLNRAVALAPADPRYLAERASLHLVEGHVIEARADLDEALRLNPSYPDALIARADLHLGTHDVDLANADLDAASHAVAPEDERRLRLARLYERAGRWEPSLTELDQWIKAHAESPELWGALMRRCWVRAALNREMDRALADCNRAVSMSLKASEAIDTRGLVHVLRGEDTAALSDFNATLALHPRSAWALFGRSLVERRKGEAKDAAADLAASVAIDRDILEQAKRVGLAP